MELSALSQPSHGRLLDIIRAMGPISRVEIAQESGMTAASVTNIVRLLLALDLVKEVGQAESTGGKRRTLLTIAPESRYAVGVHVQADRTVYTVSDMAGRMVGRRASFVPIGDGGVDLQRRLAQDVDDLLDDCGIRRDLTVGVGVASSRTVDVRVDLRGSMPAGLSRELGLPVVVDREAVAAAIGEFWQSESTHPPSFATLYMGDEFGASAVHSGAVWRGASSNAGDIGHLPLGDPDVRCRACGGRGCLQASASQEAVVRAAERAGLIPAAPQSSIGDRFDALARAAVRGEEGPAGVIARAAQLVARAAVVLVGVMDVEMVVLAGAGFAVPGALYAAEIRAALNAYAEVQGLPPVAVELAQNPRDSVAVGASALVLQGALAPRG